MLCGRTAAPPREDDIKLAKPVNYEGRRLPEKKKEGFRALGLEPDYS